MIKLTRFTQSDESITRQTHGLCDVYKDGKLVFRCSTLERPWFPQIKRWSCIEPAPNDKPVEYLVNVINGFNRTQYQSLQLRNGANKWKINVFKEAPIYFGQQLVYCQETELYEFKDFRATLVELCNHLEGETVLAVDWTDKPNIVAANLATKSTFIEDDEVLTYPED
jgi:hypothetical protein